jgi:hypothetical protein
VLRTDSLVLRTNSLVLRTDSLVLLTNSLVLRTDSLVLRTNSLMLRAAPNSWMSEWQWHVFLCDRSGIFKTKSPRCWPWHRERTADISFSENVMNQRRRDHALWREQPYTFWRQGLSTATRTSHYEDNSPSSHTIITEASNHKTVQGFFNYDGENVWKPIQHAHSIT